MDHRDPSYGFTRPFVTTGCDGDCWLENCGCFLLDLMVLSYYRTDDPKPTSHCFFCMLVDDFCMCSRVLEPHIFGHFARLGIWHTIFGSVLCACTPTDRTGSVAPWLKPMHYHILVLFRALFRGFPLGTSRAYKSWLLCTRMDVGICTTVFRAFTILIHWYTGSAIWHRCAPHVQFLPRQSLWMHKLL